MSVFSCFSILSLMSVNTEINVSATDLSQSTTEIKTMRSQYEKHFENIDGSKTAFIDTSPVHYFENGEWFDIDNTLTEDENGYYTNVGNSMKVTLAPNASFESLKELSDDHLLSLDFQHYNISWDFVNMSDDFHEENHISPIEIDASVYVPTIENDNKLIAKTINSSKASRLSSAWYKSVYDGCDINIEVRPDSVKDYTVLNTKEAAQNDLCYYIESKGLQAELHDDNSITYTDEEGNVVFTMPAPFMFEASDNNKKSYDIDVNLESYKDGYILTYCTDKEWLLSDERNYPVIIDPYVYISSNIYTATLSEQYPSSTDTSQLKIGGELGNRYSALVSVPSTVLFTNDYVSITDAELYLYFNQTTGTYPERQVAAYSILSSYWPWWSGVNTQYLAEMNRFHPTTPGLYGVNITPTVGAWQNYSRSNGKVGVYPYGILIRPVYNNGAVYNADSSSGLHSPYYIITYKTDSTYTLTHNPYKYDDFGCNDSNNNSNTLNDVHNFSRRMNCYAYALQIYDYSYTNGGASHKLYPGGLCLSSGSPFTTLTQLLNYYNNINNVSLINFVEQQMLYDSYVLGMNLNKINLSNIAQFVLPSGYNENSQRIIAMNTGLTSAGANDFHFYVRCGNGSCSQHGGTCSIWTHKPGLTNISCELNSTVICDNNIAQLAYNAQINSEPGVSTTYNTRPRFYTIQLDTNPFNSSYSYDSSNDITYLN